MTAKVSAARSVEPFTWRGLLALVSWYVAAALFLALCIALAPILLAFVLGFLMVLLIVVAACLPVALLYFALLGVVAVCGF